METDPEMTEMLKLAGKNLNNYYKYIQLFKGKKLVILSEQSKQIEIIKQELNGNTRTLYIYIQNGKFPE